jgi:hypothetical protein
MIDKAFWGPAVLGGLLGATFSSALSSMVGAPRILQALSAHGIVPGGEWLATTSSDGEPRNAMWASGGIVLAALMLRDLNVVAPFITMFFLITYGMINIVVLIESQLGLVSFRPSFKLPGVVPLTGAVGCVFAMFIINPTVSLIAVAVVVAFYAILIRRHLASPVADVRSGLFVAVAQWAAQKATDLPHLQQRAWKPNLLVPVRDPLELRGTYRFLGDLIWPSGYVELMGMASDADEREVLEASLREISQELREDNIYSRWTTLETDNMGQGIVLGMEALKGSFFQPNTVVLSLPQSRQAEEQMTRIVDSARDNGLGAIIVGMHPKTRMGSRKVVNLWIPSEAPDLELALGESRLNLAILTAYMIRQKWNAKLNIVSCLPRDEDKDSLRAELQRVAELARLPISSVVIIEGELRDHLGDAPRSDLDVFGMSSEPDYDFMRQALADTRSTCIFVTDSGQESALA